MNKNTHPFFSTAFTSLIIPLLLVGCSNNNDALPDAGSTPLEQSAVIATTAADFSSGAHAVFSTKEPFTGVTQQSPSDSDITVNCHGEYFYRIERFSGENIARFHISNPAEALYQYSSKDSSGVETSSSNPHNLVFVNEEKAYLLRYGSEKAWIVNPAATTEAEFRIGELDLSAYTVEDASAPHMDSGIIVDNKLYITLQRLDQSFAPQDAYVAVFDTLTDTEIDTAPNEEGLKGISLPVKNPGDIETLADSGLIYVQGTGRFANPFAGTEAEYTGGIASIDPGNGYTTAVILDDGDAGNHPVNLITDMQLVSADRGYIIGYAGATENSLYSFNPTSGELDIDAGGAAVPVAGIENTKLGGLALDRQNQLWVGIAADAAPGLKVLNGADGSVVKELLATTLNPAAIAICDAAAGAGKNQ